MEHAFGRTADFSLGVEEELLLVDPESHALVHRASALLERLDLPEGAAKPDLYEGCVELVSGVCATAEEATARLRERRAAVAAAGGTAMGAGIHPDGAFGDVEHVDTPRYREVGGSLRGLALRTPTCALHVHVGMPDAAAAVRAFNRLRAHLPLLQALAANSPFWHGRDSGLASARSALFRAFPRAEIPRALSDLDDWAELVDRLTAAADVPDYTFLWWDVRPHPRLGTVEVRAMDAQSSLGTVAGLAALVQGLAARATEEGGPEPPPREVLAESSYRASRDGLEATVWDGAGLRPLREVGARALEEARPAARALGSEAPLEEVQRLLREGGGAARQRAAFAEGGLPAVLAGLVAETAS